jgi:NADP-dependent 3-hydroxy acid dehydrogenase YdfG
LIESQIFKYIETIVQYPISTSNFKMFKKKNGSSRCLKCTYDPNKKTIEDIADIFIWLLSRPAYLHIPDITVTPWN